jgi:phosphatidylglycerophosphatase A
MMNKFFLTVGYSGLSPKAPGTVGSAVSLVLGYGLLYVGVPVSTLLLLAIAIGVFAVRQIDVYEDEVGEHDSKEIVIDELVGMWIALSIVGLNPVGAVLSFLGFRLFDIWKPSVIGRIDREMKGGKGVVLDDALAGVFGGLLASLVYKGLLFLDLIAL